jgi:predicted AlkP superfamily phosphohydrolase/phosphomutase
MKKILVLGLDCAAPEILLEDERLVNFRRLMAAGCYGPLESVIPPITVPAWMCLSTSQDPGSLGVYGFRNRVDHSYTGLGIVNSRSIDAVAVWDQVAREGGQAILVGVPPGFPPRKVHGMTVGCFLTPDTDKGVFTHPPELSDEIRGLVGHYPTDVKGFRSEDKAWLRDQIFEMSRTQWTVVRHLMTTKPWEYFHFVDIGLDRVHHGFWKYHDPLHVLHEPDSPFKDVIRNYYLHLDEEIGKTLELVDDNTAVVVVSDHGARRLDGGFCVNEWLIQQGLLVLNSYPDTVTPFGKLDVNWAKTRVWSEGGYYARVFLNVKGREPEGVIEPRDYEAFRDEMKALFEATTNQQGKPLGTLVFKPEEIYHQVRNVAPDLIVHFGALAWRSIGGVGYPTVHVLENDTGPDDCNHAQFGAFIIAAPELEGAGEVKGVKLLDIMPTMLELAGRDVPPSMQGRSLLEAAAGGEAGSSGYSPAAEEMVKERLRGLGYLG